MVGEEITKRREPPRDAEGESRQGETLRQTDPGRTGLWTRRARMSAASRTGWWGWPSKTASLTTLFVGCSRSTF